MKDAQVKLSPSKLDVLASAIEMFPLEVVKPLSDTPYVESTAVEQEIVAHQKNLEIAADLSVVEGEGEKEIGITKVMMQVLIVRLMMMSMRKQIRREKEYRRKIKLMKKRKVKMRVNQVKRRTVI